MPGRAPPSSAVSLPLMCTAAPGRASDSETDNVIRASREFWPSFFFTSSIIDICFEDSNGTGISNPHNSKYAVPLALTSIIPPDSTMDVMAGTMLSFLTFCIVMIRSTWPGLIVVDMGLAACPTGTPFTAKSYATFGTYTGKSPPLPSSNVRLRLIPSISANTLLR